IPPPPRSTLFPYTNALPILAKEVIRTCPATAEMLVAHQSCKADHDAIQILPSSSTAASRSRTPIRCQLVGANRKSVSTIAVTSRSEEHTSELQSLAYLVCRL